MTAIHTPAACFRLIKRLRPLALVLLLSGNSLAARAADIVIGQVAPLSGVLAGTGRDMVLGAHIYFEHINASGGINGKRIRHEVRDDGYKVDETVRLTKELIDDTRAAALIGFAGTANVGEVQKLGLLDAGKIALVAPYTGGENLRGDDNHNIFHIRAGYADEAEHMVDHLATLGIRNIAVFYQNDGFGEAGKRGVEAALTKRGLTLAAAASYERNTDEVASAVDSIRKSAAAAVIMISVNRSTAAFAKAYRAAGGSAQLLNISVVDAGQLVRLSGIDAVHGLGISQVMPFPYSETQPVTREFRKLFAKYAPAGTAISYTSFEEFIGAKILVEAIRRAGPAPTPERILRALETLGNHDVGGFIVDFSPSRHAGSHFVEVTVIGRSGRLLH